MNIKNKVAIVTGGNSGLGEQISIQLANLGAKVVVAARRIENGNKVVSNIKNQGKEAIFVKCDISKEEEVIGLVDTCIQKFGRLDIAINNAGTTGPSKRLNKYSSQEFESILNVNLKGTFLCMKYQIPKILENGAIGGAIVNIASIYGIVGSQFGGSAYCASKHGIVGLTKSVALEFAKKNIRVNAICPGGIQTDMLDGIFNDLEDPIAAAEGFKALHPMRRFSTPSEIANAVVWLCSDEASFITGVALPVDGGFTAQ